jgi:hypothetical protein
MRPPTILCIPLFIWIFRRHPSIERILFILIYDYNLQDIGSFDWPSIFQLNLDRWLWPLEPFIVSSESICDAPFKHILIIAYFLSSHDISFNESQI